MTDEMVNMIDFVLSNIIGIISFGISNDYRSGYCNVLMINKILIFRIFSIALKK